MILQYLLVKLLRFRDYKVLLGIAQATEQFFGCRSNWKKHAFSLLQFYYDFTMLQIHQKKKEFTQADRALGIEQFYKHGRYLSSYLCFFSFVFSSNKDAIYSYYGFPEWLQARWPHRHSGAGCFPNNNYA